MDRTYRKEQRTAIITVPVGASKGEAVMDDLPRGKVVYMGASGSRAQTGLVRLSVERNGQQIVKPANLSWFDGGLGSFEQRALQIADQGGTRLDLKVETTTPVADTPLLVEVIFQSWVEL